MFKPALFLGVALLATTSAHAKDEDDEDAKEGIELLSEFVAGFAKDDGLFPLYRDPKTGDAFIELPAERLGDEFIYFTYIENGPVETRHYRGRFQENRIVRFNRRFDRVEVEAVNAGYYVAPENALSRAAEANIARAPLANVQIKAESKDGRRILISADDLLETESLHRVQPWKNPDAKAGEEFDLGELSEDKTEITQLASFPKNTDIRVEYVYDNANPVNYGDESVTDPRSVAILVQHSFLEMPEPGYEPRRDDYRVGYFTDQITDLTSESFTPYRDVINRWRLEKKNPEAAVSDPVKPITFWIENTTPVEWRGLIADAALRWNLAFEAAGISNALEIKIQPDDADWDAGDVRYNVIRWTASPTPPFGGYGPRFTNPRTGEILGADIMMEANYVHNGQRWSKIFGTGGDPEDVASNALVRQALQKLVLHEIGHTLGLNHNMRSSHTVPAAALHDPDALTSNSVMDYNAINIVPIGEQQGQFDPTRPGPYDIWAIQYGYTPKADALPAIIARSTEPELAFGNDADDVRAPGRHVDPRVMVDDLTDDPITWAAERSQLIDETFRLLPDRMLEPGGSYEPLLDAYRILFTEKRIAATVASRWIGGVFNNRSAVGQSGAQQPIVPVPVAEQRRALAVLDNIAFAPDAFVASESLLDRLQVQRRGFDWGNKDLAPRPHERALSMQRSLLDHLLHPNVLTRLTDARRYGGAYPVSTYIDELTGVMFDVDRQGRVNTYRQNLQIEYVTRLITVAAGDAGGTRQTSSGPEALPNFDYVARSAALASIAQIKAIARTPGVDAETQAHRHHILSLIEEFERR